MMLWKFNKPCICDKKTEQFLILSDNTACSRISTCPAHVLKISPAIFPGRVFFANPGGKSAVKLSEKWKSQLLFAVYQKVRWNSSKKKNAEKKQQVRAKYKKPLVWFVKMMYYSFSNTIQSETIGGEHFMWKLLWAFIGFWRALLKHKWWVGWWKNIPMLMQ